MLTKAEWTPLRMLSLRNTQPPSVQLRTDSTQTVIGWKRSQSARVESRRKHVRILNKVYIVRVYPNSESSYTRVFHVVSCFKLQCSKQRDVTTSGAHAAQTKRAPDPCSIPAWLCTVACRSQQQRTVHEVAVVYKSVHYARQY